MHFLLSRVPSSASHVRVVSLPTRSEPANILWIEDSPKHVKRYTSDRGTIVVIGDLVVGKHKQANFELFHDAILSNGVHRFGGFFYLLYLDANSPIVRVYSSLFGILPLYYYESRDQILVSSSIRLILDSVKKDLPVDKQYILERTLFNYGLFNRTYFVGIKLLKANHYAEIDSGVKEVSQFDATDLYTADPQKGKPTLERLSDFFVRNTEKYLGEEEYALSFTGGFDGRSLLGVSKYFGRNFFTYSFGSEDSRDVLLPLSQSATIGVRFTPIYLDAEYLAKWSYTFGRELIEKTEGYASFARAHYLYAAKQLSLKANYIITGNFGSELLRALHNSGVMISKELIEFFRRDNGSWEKEWAASPRLSVLRKAGLGVGIQQVIEEAHQFKATYSGLNRNQLLYVYLLNEIFRKYFGPEVCMQRYFLFNRAPFLDYDFIKELFATYYSGPYSDFFTDNPAKRAKGQLLYAYIMKRTYPLLLRLMTGKGYRPDSLLGELGKLDLLLKFMKKKLSGNTIGSHDPFAVDKAFHSNRDKWLTVPILQDFYDATEIKQQVQSGETNSDFLSNVISANYYLMRHDIQDAGV